MQHEYRFLEFNRVNGPVRAVTTIRDGFQNSRATSKNLGRLVLVTALRKVQGMTEKLANGHQQRHQVPLATPYPHQRLLLLPGHTLIIPEKV